jgi:adenylate kinase family enzyme
MHAPAVPPRLHIVGASGSGTTTLGAALAPSLGLPHLDSDDYFSMPTDPPYAAKRPPAERDRLLSEQLTGEGWVLSGSVVSWDARISRALHAHHLPVVPPEIRLARLRAREIARYGDRLAPGGDMERASREFMAWAKRYETAGMEQRSLTTHNAWLAEQSAPVLRIEGALPIGEAERRARDFVFGSDGTGSPGSVGCPA